jgi:alkyl hydroperoxide reductase subunit D
LYAPSASIVGSKCHFLRRVARYALLKNEQGMSALQLRDDGRIAAVVNAAAQVLAIEGR